MDRSFITKCAKTDIMFYLERSNIHALEYLVKFKIHWKISAESGSFHWLKPLLKLKYSRHNFWHFMSSNKLPMHDSKGVSSLPYTPDVHLRHSSLEITSFQKWIYKTLKRQILHLLIELHISTQLGTASNEKFQKRAFASFLTDSFDERFRDNTTGTLGGKAIQIRDL